MSLRIGRRQAVHHFPAADQDLGVREGAREIGSRLQALPEQGVAKIGPVPSRGAAEGRARAALISASAGISGCARLICATSNAAQSAITFSIEPARAESPAGGGS